MQHGDPEAGLRCELGQVPFPHLDSVAVRATGIGGNRESRRVGKPLAAMGVPPAADRFHRELGGVGAVTGTHPASVVPDVVDAVRDRLGELAQRLILEVVDIDPFRVALGPPVPTPIRVSAD